MKILKLQRVFRELDMSKDWPNVTDSVTEEVEATTEDRRIRKKPSWMGDYQM